jgi:hypothetical protein
MAIDRTAAGLVHSLTVYLRNHPRASDSPEGIARWWLALDDQPEALQRALDWMAGRGWIERSIAADGRVRWRRSGDATIEDPRRVEAELRAEACVPLPGSPREN